MDGIEKIDNNSLASTPKTKADVPAWYVLRVTYQRELIAHNRLEALGVESYVPIQKRRIARGGRVVIRTVSLLHNYIFVHATLAQIKEIKENHITFLRYMMGHDEDGNRCHQIVPDDQMRNFIAITGNDSAIVKYLDPNVIDLTKGDRVRILSGPFEGVEGTFMKISAKNEKRVVVKIEGVAAVATAAIPAALVEKI